MRRGRVTKPPRTPHICILRHTRMGGNLSLPQHVCPAPICPGRLARRRAQVDATSASSDTGLPKPTLALLVAVS